LPSGASNKMRRVVLSVAMLAILHLPSFRAFWPGGLSQALAQAFKASMKARDGRCRTPALSSMPDSLAICAVKPECRWLAAVGRSVSFVAGHASSVSDAGQCPVLFFGFRFRFSPALDAPALGRVALLAVKLFMSHQTIGRCTRYKVAVIHSCNSKSPAASRRLVCLETPAAGGDGA
jgi:hypothetical protein